MKIRFRALAVSSVSLCALGAASLASPSFAADANVAATAAADTDAAAAATDAAAPAALGEVIVTAQKRSENLQKTPISISVMNAQALENEHIQSLTDLISGGIPSLHVAPYASRPFNLILDIRGVGVMTDTNQPARDSGVGVYIDGVYLGRPQGLDAALYDLDSIEVLKGPQGTLFGRNTEGGALNITTKKPTGQGELDVTGGAGNYGSYETEGHLDLPEYNGFSVKVDGVITSRDGFINNPLAGAADYGAYDRHGAWVQVQWKPMPNFTANYAYDTSYDASTTLYSQTVQAGSNAIAPLLPLQPGPVSSATVGVPLQPSIGTQSGHTLNLKWDVSPKLTIKSISSYRQLYQNQWQDGPSGAVFTPNAQFARYSLAAFQQSQYSEELQAIGETDHVKYVVGALAYHEHVADLAQTFNALQFNATGTAATVLPLGSTDLIPVRTDGVAALFPTAGIDRASRVSSDSYGVYGQATYTPPVLNDIFHLTGGFRWTDDTKVGELYIVNNAPPVDAYGNVGPARLNKDWSRVDPMINLAADITPDAEAYVKWGTGYRSGGANSRSLTYLSFNPEEISMYETGLKTEFWDHRGRFNIAAYTGDYTNIQVDFTAPYYSYNAAGQVIVTASTTRTTTNTINAPGTGHVHGVETEFALAPVQGLTLTASYAYNYVHIPATINPFPVYQPGIGTVVNTTPIAIYQEFTPNHTVSMAADYMMPFEHFALKAHLDGNWNSGSYDTDRDPSPGLPAIQSQPGLVFNGRLSFADFKLNSGALLTFSLWSRNLFDNRYLYIRSNSATTGIGGTYNDPRTFGMQINVKF